MRRLMLVLGLISVLGWTSLAIAYTNDEYPYNTTSSCIATCVKDDLGFCQNNCTSYVAYVLNRYGVPFSNSYKGAIWSHGGNWDNAASQISGQNITVDNYPIPGDVAYWNSMYENDPYGHVAFVEKVYYDGNGNPTGIDVTEYNYTYSCKFDERSGNSKLNVGSSNYPSGFIHILAYEEGVSGLYYLDSYETNSPSQTKQEWGWILSRVWNSYRCKNCDSDYDLAYINTISNAVGGMGGGAGYETPAADPSIPNLPDFITKKTWLTTPWGTETYKFGMNESFDTKAQSANIGDGSCLSSEIQTITGHFYLSNGYKEDVHSGDGAWRRLDSTTTQCDNLKPGDTHTETKNTVIREWITTPGIYNIVYCIDHPLDDHNNGGDHQEKHESNNCSTEAVLEVTGDAYVNVPDTDFIISAIQVKASTTQLPAGGITNLQMAIRNVGTVTPTTGIRSNYSFCGPLPNTACVQVADDGSEAGELTPGHDQWEETLAPVPVPATAGSYLLKGCADYQNTVLETDETNNCSTIMVQVVVPSPDLIVSALGLREGTSIKAGTRVHPWCTVTNIGGPSPATMRLAYYINWNVYRDSDAVEAYELCAGCSKKEEVFNDNIKLGDKGTRTYRCCVDYQGAVAESNESNNCAVMSFTVR